MPVRLLGLNEEDQKGGQREGHETDFWIGERGVETVNTVPTHFRDG